MHKSILRDNSHNKKTKQFFVLVGCGFVREEQQRKATVLNRGDNDHSNINSSCMPFIKRNTLQRISSNKDHEDINKLTLDICWGMSAGYLRNQTMYLLDSIDFCAITMNLR